MLGSKYDAGSPHLSYVAGRPQAVELQRFAKWQAGCSNLVRLLGSVGEQWRDDLLHKRNDPGSTKRTLGTLEAIREAVEHGLLVTVEELVRAEAFDSLLDQAAYLESEGYFLAAGVIGRAVLEEHLRKLCEAKSCSPAKPKPTINDFKDSLYKAKHITATVMKHVESMAAVGNEAAHNKDTLDAAAVGRLLRDVRDFLVRNPLA